MSDTLPPQTRVIGRYSILKELRRERHSVSYAAVDPVMNRQLVLKAVELLPAGPKLSGEERQRVEQAFVRQAQAAGRLQHPHIVTVFDAGLSHAFGFLVIERINGRPLHELIAGGLRPEFVQCASIGARIADALECAHANGVAHGHLGPQHVYLQADGSPKINGFGGWIDDGASGDEALAGTARLLPYFQNEINEESRLRDLRAVGQLLFMMLAGHAPPAEPSGSTAHEAGSLTRGARADTPPALARLVDQALLAGAADGPRTAGMLRDALTAFIWNERAENVSPSRLGIPLAPPPARTPMPAATLTSQQPGPQREAPAPVGPSTVTATLAPTHPATRAPVPAPVAADASTQKAAVAQPPAPATAARTPGTLRNAGAPAAPEPNLDFKALVATLKPWAIKYRIAIFAVGAFFFLSIFLGVLLGNLRHGAGAATTAGAAEGGAPAVAVVAPTVRATLTFDVRPWGEVFIDGKPTGVVPPMTQTDLPAGHHHVEIHHDNSPPWSKEIDVNDATPIHIEHAFE